MENMDKFCPTCRKLHAALKGVAGYEKAQWRRRRGQDWATGGTHWARSGQISSALDMSWWYPVCGAVEMQDTERVML